MAQSAPLRSFGGQVEAPLGPAQFQVRMPEASLRLPQGGLRIEADWIPDGPWTDCELHSGPPAM
eukprot:5907915-Alexandrium_andersonii.AAC.1